MKILLRVDCLEKLLLFEDIDGQKTGDIWRKWFCGRQYGKDCPTKWLGGRYCR
jgi:hypothetical protein